MVTLMRAGVPGERGSGETVTAPARVGIPGSGGCGASCKEATAAGGGGGRWFGDWRLLWISLYPCWWQEGYEEYPRDKP